MKIGYIRVSTDQQSHQRQLDGLQSHCDEVHCETVSAVKKKRPVYQKVLRKLRKGDTLVVWDLDRAFRSTIDALTEVEKLRGREYVSIRTDCYPEPWQWRSSRWLFRMNFDHQADIQETTERGEWRRVPYGSPCRAYQVLPDYNRRTSLLR